MAEIQICVEEYEALVQLMAGKHPNLAKAAEQFGLTQQDLAQEVVRYVDSSRYLGDVAEVIDAFQLSDSEVCRVAWQLESERQKHGLASKIRRAIAKSRRRSRPKGPQLRPDQIILRPLITEKGVHQSTRYNTYAFEVNQLATKPDIRQAVETMFGVKVISVRTQNRKGKPLRYRFKSGRTRNWKRAMVQLDAEDRIDFI